LNILQVRRFATPAIFTRLFQNLDRNAMIKIKMQLMVLCHSLKLSFQKQCAHGECWPHPSIYALRAYSGRAASVSNHAKHQCMLLILSCILFGSLKPATQLSLADLINKPLSKPVTSKATVVPLTADLTIPAGAVITIPADTEIDGYNHEIVFQDGAPGGRIVIAGPAGTALTFRNCIIRGLKNYSDGTSSIAFSGASEQKLVLNNSIVHLAGNYNFNDGFLDIKNSVRLQGCGSYFVYNSQDELTIKADSELFIDTRTQFTYDPLLKHKKPSGYSLAKLIVMEDCSSRLFLNGCTLYLPLGEGLVLTKGHLLVDHKTIVYGNGAVCGSFSYGMAFGNIKEGNDLLVDIMPGADLQFIDTTLHYNNLNG
jgi:hypothetical protein